MDMFEAVMSPEVTSKLEDDSDCLHFDCDWDLTRCAPASIIANETEDYYHPHAIHAPCCNDILRKVHEKFAEEMCTIGLGSGSGLGDWSVLFGSLIGVIRNNGVIPWTHDNDYLVHETTMAAMIKHWNATRSGISLFYLDIYRMCVNNHFQVGT